MSHLSVQAWRVQKSIENYRADIKERIEKEKKRDLVKFYAMLRWRWRWSLGRLFGKKMPTPEYARKHYRANWRGDWNFASWTYIGSTHANTVDKLETLAEQALKNRPYDATEEYPTVNLSEEHVWILKWLDWKSDAKPSK